MSQDYFILKTLNLKDNNIKFYQNYLTEAEVKGKRSLIYHGYLTYIPNYCPNCGCVMEKNHIVKHGYKLVKIKLPLISRLNTYLYLNKQRYKCKYCNKTFTCTTDEINSNCSISNNTKYSIALDLTNKISEKDIAIANNISVNSVERIIDSFYDIDKVWKNYLPKNLCFDEFKSVKSADGNMSFNMCDADTGNIVDIVENRQLAYLTKYFSRYSKEALNNVENIVIDMYSPYVSLIENTFLNAKIIIDKFHVIQLLSRSLNKTRIMIMKKDKKNYNKMKRYWKLLLKSSDELDYSKWKHFTCFDNLTTESDIVKYILAQNSELKETYQVYQDVLFAIKSKDKTKFDEIISNSYTNISTYMITSLNTLKEYKEYIHNTIDSNLTNGKMEGNNNLIKVIKRIAFGFRSFRRFKARIMIIVGLLKPNKKELRI
ncbi:MAG: ISL3 family transposase [Bacilli bacterium]